MNHDECDQRTQECFNRFDRGTRERRDYCVEGRRAMACVRSLDCPSTIYKLMTYRHVVRVLYNADVLNCDLGSFLEDFPSECSNNPSLRRCVTTYVDRIMTHTNTVTDKEAACQDMNDYVRCQMHWNGGDCDVNKETLGKFTEEEKRRLSLPGCEVTALNGAATPGQMGMLVVTVTALLARLLTLNLN